MRSGGWWASGCGRAVAFGSAPLPMASSQAPQPRRTWRTPSRRPLALRSHPTTLQTSGPLVANGPPLRLIAPTKAVPQRDGGAGGTRQGSVPPSGGIRRAGQNAAANERQDALVWACDANAVMLYCRCSARAGMIQHRHQHQHELLAQLLPLTRSRGRRSAHAGMIQQHELLAQLLPLTRSRGRRSAHAGMIQQHELLAQLLPLTRSRGRRSAHAGMIQHQQHELLAQLLPLTRSRGRRSAHAGMIQHQHQHELLAQLLPLTRSRGRRSAHAGMIQHQQHELLAQLLPLTRSRGRRSAHAGMIQHQHQHELLAQLLPLTRSRGRRSAHAGMIQHQHQHELLAQLLPLTRSRGRRSAHAGMIQHQHQHELLAHRSDRTRRRRQPRQRSHLVDHHPANTLCPPTRPTHRTARHAVEVSTRTAPFAGHALTASSWWPSTGPDHGSEAEMPTLGTVAMNKNRDCDTPAARTGNTTADKPYRHAAPPTRPNDPLRWPHQRIQICRLTSHNTISGTHRQHPLVLLVGAGNSAVVVELPRCGPMLSPRVPNFVPIPGPRMERETPGQRPRPNYGHPQAQAFMSAEKIWDRSDCDDR